MGKKKRFLVPVNVRYKEYHVVEVDEDVYESPSDAQDVVLNGGGHEIRPLREYVEAMDSEHWDDPIPVDEQEYIQYLNDDAHYIEGRSGDPDDG